MANLLRNPLSLFFVLAFAITWGTGLAALGLRDLGLVAPTFERFDPLANLLLFIALWGPGFSGLLMGYREKGWRGMAVLVSGLFVFGTGWRWWAAAILLPLGLQVAALFIAHMLAGVSLSRFGPENWTSAAYFFVFGFLCSPLGEEIGWRGYALPRLMQRMSALAAALVLGLIWIAWHAPAFVIPVLARSILPSGVSYFEFAAMALPVTVLVTWMYLRGHSLLQPVIFHFLVLFQATSIQESAAPPLVWTSIGLFAAAALLVIGRCGWALSRGAGPTAR
ncbi:CPBP family intramembrane glutamic endopeptidase [Chelativorans sp. AA-79]|uniref:CPBP family intramembrane glutamic endopeptidase n=1 Tax=Chelativorans sp. AA-79 TaxID=3028735 RepID=UPI0023F7706C|nr:CPBP family intramembrane glutamic endopeptidase [Chelativorans sp. AA-79]WEX08971.1 CPBP family intramembrane metalloprotease [Chelativorans sp. AA-79]